MMSAPVPNISMHAPLLIDMAGTRLDADDRRRLADPLVGGIIYFGRTWESRAQITALSAEIRSLRPDVLICIDHEGGRVQRFRTDGFTHLPPLRHFGRLWMDDGAAGRPGEGAQRAMAAATAAGYVLASELRACGIDFSFTPVLDLDHGESGIIGDRSFHRDPRVVAALGRSLAHGLLQAGMHHCGKHFPGHGFVRADSHTDVAVDDRSLAEILVDDSAPYRWLAGSLSAVMPAHVVYPSVDPRPAGFSRRWLQEILRGQLGFRGAIISDDLSMEAARPLDGRLLGFEAAVLAALGAGCDLALLCNQSLQGGTELDAALAGLARAQADGSWQPSAASEARRLALQPVGQALDWDALLGQERYQSALRLLG